MYKIIGKIRKIEFPFEFTLTKQYDQHGFQQGVQVYRPARRGDHSPDGDGVR